MAELRFYAELNDFLAPTLRGRGFVQACAPHESAKHVIEAQGVPHTEVGLLLLDGEPVGLGHRPLREDERLAVYPHFRALPVGQAPAQEGEAAPRFAADAHLGRLARWLRFAGHDTLYRNDWPDAELVAVALAEDRILLTRDRDLLMHRDVRRGCYLHAVEPLAQLRELARRLHLRPPGSAESRCLLCNAPLAPVAKAEVAHRLQPGTLAHFDAFWRCPGCERVYWRGSHWERMRATLGPGPPGGDPAESGRNAGGK